MTQKIEQDRKQFEAWMKTRMPSGSLDREHLPDKSSYYFNSLVEMAWQGWSAALASHAPSDGPTDAFPHIGHPINSANDVSPSEAAAQPERYRCCGADFAKQHEPTCHNYVTEFDNDH